MTPYSKGIHHITSIVGDPQENVDFYGNVLGMRMTKKTVNHDDPETYHLYFSNGQADPGTHITFFPWEGAMRGRVGDGQVGVTVYAVPKGSLEFWKHRLKTFDIDFSLEKRFGKTYLRFHDPHGLVLELSERETGKLSSYTYGDIEQAHAIKGFDGVVLYSLSPSETAQLLVDVLGFKKAKEDAQHIRLVSDGEFGDTVDIKRTLDEKGFQGTGTVHHIAWRTQDDTSQQTLQSTLNDQSYHVTPVIDRKYFHSIYFRERGKILFEIATDGPGFDVDEPFEALGESLTLPERYEPYRARIEQILKPLEVPRGKLSTD